MGELRWDFPALIAWRKGKVETSPFFILPSFSTLSLFWLDYITMSCNGDNLVTHKFFCEKIKKRRKKIVFFNVLQTLFFDVLENGTCVLQWVNPVTGKYLSVNWWNILCISKCPKPGGHCISKCQKSTLCFDWYWNADFFHNQSKVFSRPRRSQRLLYKQPCHWLIDWLIH